MKSKLTFTPGIIDFIRNRSRQLIEDWHNDEMDFFDDIWEIYEEQLMKWLNQPPKKWRFKTSKLKIPNFSSVSGGPESLVLVTPKILEVISLSYARIIAMKAHSHEKVEAIISKCVKKLPKDIREETISYLTPLMQMDSRKVLNIPESEVFKSNKINKFIMYTDEEIEGKQLTKKEYFKIKKETESQAQDYKFIIDEVKYECFFNGRKVEGKKKPVKPAWRAFIYLILNKNNSGVDYRDIFQYARIKEKYHKKFTFEIVQKWISLFRKYVDEDDDLRWFFTPIEKFGYEYQMGANFSFCVFQPYDDVPK